MQESTDAEKTSNRVNWPYKNVDMPQPFIKAILFNTQQWARIGVYGMLLKSFPSLLYNCHEDLNIKSKAK